MGADYVFRGDLLLPVVHPKASIHTGDGQVQTGSTVILALHFIIAC